LPVRVLQRIVNSLYPSLHTALNYGFCRGEKTAIKKRSSWRLYQAFLSIYAAGCGLLLAWQCYTLWLRGNAPQNRDADGLLLSPVFSREKIAAMLRISAPWLYGFIAAALLGCLWHALQPQHKSTLKSTRPMELEAALPAQRVIRIVILAAAIILIVLGIMNGGMRDVLIKAIYICTECIGLG